MSNNNYDQEITSAAEEMIKFAERSGLPPALTDNLKDMLSLDDLSEPELSEPELSRGGGTFIGTPFDTTLDANWVDIPSNAFKQLDSETRKVYNTNYRTWMDEQVERVIDGFAGRIMMTSSLSQKYNYEVDEEELKEFFLKSVEHSFKHKSKKANRYLQRLLIPYDLIMLETIEKKPNELILNKVFKADKLRSLIHSTQHLFEGDLKLSSTGIIYNKILLSYFYEGAEIPKGFYSCIKAAGLEDLVTELIPRLFTLLENKIEVKATILGLWTVCRLLDDDNLFYTAYTLNKDVFNESDYPFLNFPILNTMGDLIKRPDGNGLTYIDHQFYAVFLRVIDEINISNKNDRDKVALIKQELQRDCFDHLGKPDIHLMTKECNVIFDRIKGYLSQFYGEEDKAYKSYVEHGRNFINNLSLLNTTKHNFSTCNTILKTVKGSFEGLVRAFSDMKEELEAVQKDIVELNTKAIELGRDPLDNIENLIEIKEQIRSKTEIQDRLLDASSNDVEEHNADLSNRTQVLLKLLGSSQGKEVNAEKMKIETLEEQVKVLEAELENANYEMDLQQEKISKLNSKVIYNGNDSNEAKTFNLGDMNAAIVSILDNKSSISTIFNVLDATNTGKMILSSKARKSIKSIKHFSNFSLLYSKLSTLLSDDFIDAYTNSGSVKAFSFLSRNELSFQESETVKNKQLRHCTFEGHGQLDCKAHIKIGVNNREQHMLRIYFAIKDNQVFIGDVVRHLPCS
ncbi:MULTISPECIES: hypothetical protein [unclassified Pseudoalteromonas]|uniref:coiled-coil domain-containing protein n=1 Tax=unclassified Pseudoalteromonas TaxID=194690 RepID=UPI00235A439A|nr:MULTISPECIES: hypothetical protein [unclassified Pseudoalteromonas]MDC9563384.1 hypothetical protein [Pseudoalteromonas sp. GAB2316C]MDC9572134.1 hypothetical protein [Pseudoalteromonas sp. GABNS16A]MDC9583831.1 hypothetical protein [Pseudoalteromonas sp. GABNS16C]MDC9607773.1 hypothetical protein [Pseudoalteromonas sp. GABNS16H]